MFLRIISGDVRLSNGPDDLTGELQIYHHGLWGDVCGAYDFPQSAADIVCKQIIG